METGKVVVALIGAFLVSSFFQTHYLAFAEGDSMQPTFSGCTLVSVNHEFLPSQAREGEIVVVELNEPQNGISKIVHRVVENSLEQEKLSTRGDNDSYYEFSSSIDGFFDYDSFLGKVEHFYNLPLIVCSLKGGDKRG